MKLLFRTDANRRTSGGHVMRCLALANAATARGARICFVMADGPDAMTKPVLDAGFELHLLPQEAHTSTDQRPYADWLSLGRDRDAELTNRLARSFQPDWIVWDHYGLDGQWADHVRDGLPDTRILAIDDLDDRPLGSDLVLDQARLEEAPRRFPVPHELRGHEYALLRAEFAHERPNALARRGDPVRRILISPGTMDHAHLAPRALRALAHFPELDVEVVMSGTSQSVPETRDLVSSNPRWHLTLDATDMAKRMSAADFCIGAGGTSSWERCCLGLPTLIIAVAENQQAGVDALVADGAAIEAKLADLDTPDVFAEKLGNAIKKSPTLATAAARVSDGLGADRVLDKMEAITGSRQSADT